MDLLPYLLVDPHGNMNNHDAVLIDRAVYRANAAFYRLENTVAQRLSDIKDATK
jgi:hypothetical protein